MLPARNAREQEGVEHHVSCLLPRLIRATDGPGTITFLGSARSGTFLGSARSAGAAGAGDGPGETVEWARLFEDAQGYAAALQARGVGPGSHVALLGPTSRPLVTAIEATWLAGATLVGLPLPMRLGSIEEFAHQTRAAHPERGRRRRRRGPRARAVPGRRTRRPAGRPARRAAGPAGELGAARRRPRRARDHPVHERVDRRPQGRDAHASLPRDQHRRHRRGRRARRRGPRRVVAAALPRHGSHRSPDDADAHRLRSRHRAARRTSSPRRATGCGGCRSTAGRSPADRTSRTRSPPAPCAGSTASTSRRGAWRSTAPSRSTRVPSRRSARPAPATGSTRRPRSASTAWPRRRWRISFPVPGTGMTVDIVDNVALETERFAAPATTTGTDARRLVQLGRTLPRARAAGLRSRDRQPPARPRGGRARAAGRTR